MAIDLQSFYQQAKTWERLKTESEEQQAAENARTIAGHWEQIAQVIRLALPIEGLSIHESRPGQFAEMPTLGYIHPVHVQINPEFKPAMEVPIRSANTPGMIVVQVIYDLETPNPEWAIDEYKVWQNGEFHSFDNPYQAFLAAFEPIKEAEQP